MAMYLTNGTLNYNLTKEYILTPEQIAERNNMIPDYPDPNDERFKETLPVFIIQDNQLCRDGVAIGKIYNNKTGKVVEITETTETGFKYQNTEEDALINKDNSIAVVEKLTGLKGELITGPDFNGHEYIDFNLPSGKLWSKEFFVIDLNTEPDMETLFGGTWRLPNQEEVGELLSNTNLQVNSNFSLTIQEKNSPYSSVNWTNGWQSYFGSMVNQADALWFFVADPGFLGMNYTRYYSGGDAKSAAYVSSIPTMPTYVSGTGKVAVVGIIEGN